MRRDRASRTRLADLAGVGAAIRERELAVLAAALREVARIESEIAELLAERARRGAEISSLEEPDPALLAGMDARWNMVLDQRCRTLEMQLAKARADQEETRARAALAVGRADVLDGLAKGGG